MLIIIVFLLVGFLAANVLSTFEDRALIEDYTSALIDKEQIYLLSKLSFDVVSEILKEDNPDYDYIGEMWSDRLQLPLENSTIVMSIVDQERFLNPNMLVYSKNKQKYTAMFKKLTDLLDIDNTVIYNIIDWIDKDSSGSGELYTDFPAKNNSLNALEELLLIKGVSREVFYGTVLKTTGFKPGLRSVLTVYSNGKVNINTANKWVLMSLDEDIDQTVAENIIKYRAEKPFRNINDLSLVDGMTSDIIHRISPIIDVKSENFLVNIEITTGGKNYRLQFLARRKGKNISIIWKRVY